MAIDQIAQSGLSSLKVIYYSAQLFRGKEPEHDHWRMHDAERKYVGPRQGDFAGSDKELFDAYKKAYSSLDDIKVDVRSPNGTHILGSNVTPSQAVDLIENWLTKQGLM